MAAGDERITVDPAQCGGRPCIRGMRIRASDVLDLLSVGKPEMRCSRNCPIWRLKTLPRAYGSPAAP